MVRDELTRLSNRLPTAEALDIADSPHPADLELCFSPQGLRLKEKVVKGESIIVDFASASFLYRLLRGGGRKQALARAIGLKPGYNPSVIDATAGLGRDGFILAALGCQVGLCERSAAIAALLADGLRRAATDPRLSAIAARIALYQGDSRHYLPSLPTDKRPEVIYLDPMFPSRGKKSALIKKEMRLVRKVVGDDEDTAELLRTALSYAGKRVVCKRPIEADPLSEDGQQGRALGPDFAITTPNHRFDVYLTGGQIREAKGKASSTL